jgi:hypothetical protein
MSHLVQDPAQTVLQGFYTVGEHTVNRGAGVDRVRGGRIVDR